MQSQISEVMLGSIEIFCLCAELGSFTQAAVKAGITPAAVSRSIARLEARLGIKLFVRTTRRIGLTDSGQHYFEQCKQALTQLRDAERELTGKQITPSGVIHLSLPTTYGHFRVIPLLPKFQKLYPDVRLEIHLSNQNIDFASGRFDLAIRARTPPDSGLVARPLEEAKLVTVATPLYLQTNGEPKSLEELNQHKCIQYRLPSSGQTIPWRFKIDDKIVETETSGSCFFSEDILGALTMARHGGGIAQLYHFIVKEDLNSGRLREVLTPFSGATRPFSLIYPQDPHMPLRLRVMIDFLVGQLAGKQL